MIKAKQFKKIKVIKNAFLHITFKFISKMFNLIVFACLVKFY